MQYHSFFILLLVTVITIGLAVYITSQPQQQTPSLLYQPLFPELVHQANEVVSITISDVKTTTTIVRQNINTDQWIVQPKNYPASFDRIKALVIGIAHLQILEERTHNPERFNRLHLQDLQNTDSQAIQITLHNTQNIPIASFLLGKKSQQPYIPTTDRFFIRKTNDNQSWLVQGNLNIDTPPLSWIDPTLPNIPEENVKLLIIQSNDEYLTFERHTPEQHNFNTITGLPENKAHNTQKINSLTQIAVDLSFQDVQPEETIPFDTHQTLVNTEIETFNGLYLIIQTIQQQEQFWMKFSATPALSSTSNVQEQVLNINRYSPWAYQISPRLAEKLRTRSQDLIE